MKHSLTLCAVLFSLFPSFANAQEAKEARPWLVTLSANHGVWESSDTGGKGNQTVGLAQAAYETSNWGGAVTGNFAKTSYRINSAQSGNLDISTLTDTNVGGHYNFKWDNYSLRAGLDLNLPTGKRGYTTSQMTKLIVDDINQDLMLVNTYGTGLNVGPYFLAAMQSDSLSVGAGAKYTFMGEYDPAPDTDGDNFDPGDRLMLMLNGMAKVREGDFVILTLIYNTFGKDKSAGQDTFRSGDIFSVEARYVAKWEENFDTAIGALMSIQGKNESLSDGGSLKPETGNSNSNSFQIFVNNVYRYSDEFTFTGVAGYRQVAANGYSAGEGLYDAGRRKIYVEPGLAWHFTLDSFVTVKLRYSRVADKQDTFSPTDADYNVFNLDTAVVFGF